MNPQHAAAHRRRAPQRGQPRHRQQGVVLILALLFTLAILILGGSAVRTVVLAEKKGGHLRNQSMSFEAAEAALLAAEAHLKATWPLVHDAANPGDYGPSDAAPLGAGVDGGVAASWQGFEWKDKATAVKVTINGVGDRPAYYVIETLGTPAAGSTVSEAYRVTAYAQGGSSEAATLLQSNYTR